MKPNLIWLLLFGVLIFLSFNKHSKSPVFSYHSIIHADKAGYYVYLPALFIYGLDIDKMPEEIDKKSGEGFEIDFKKKVFKTKYTSGVAILEMPFFLAAHGLAHLLGKETSGFSKFYYGAVDVAAVFYLMIGLLLLYGSLQNFYTKKITILTLAFIFLGTNLYYYAIDETGMSHVYSFALFSAFFYLLVLHEKFVGRSVLYGVLLGFVMGMIVLVRPTNALFVLILGVSFIKKLYDKGFVMDWKVLLSALITGSIVFIPQLLYWKWAFGSYVSYSYGTESFSNWNSPMVLETLFAPNNGLFSYSYVMIFVLVGLGFMLYEKRFLGWSILSLFVLITYMTASWWTYDFGCGYGARNFVEYYTVLAIPLGAFLTKIDRLKIRHYLYPLILLLIVLNLRMTYHFGQCWFGDGNWDWTTYFDKL